VNRTGISVDRATRLSIAGAGASDVCAHARGMITISALSNSRAAVQSASFSALQPPLAVAKR
jgi:hypothetical protein